MKAAKHPFSRIQLLFGCIAGAITLAIAPNAQAQNTYTFGGTGANGHWLLADSWTGGVSGKIPGMTGNATINNGTESDIAVFAAVKPTGQFDRVSINMNSNSAAANGSLKLGAIWLNSAVAADFGIHNNGGGFDGILTLTGNTINATANTILANDSNYTVRFWNIGGGSRSLGLALGNATENVIQINGSGDIRIESTISAASGIAAPNLTLRGSGTGSLILSGTNTYGGQTTVLGGTVVAAAKNALGESKLVLGGASQAATLRITTGIALSLSELELTSDSRIVFNLNGTYDATKITVDDQIGGGTYLVDIVNNGELNTGEYLLLEATTWDASGFALANPISGFEHSFLSWNDGKLSLIVTAVPEPSTALLILLAGGSMAWTARRKLAKN